MINFSETERQIVPGRIHYTGCRSWERSQVVDLAGLGDEIGGLDGVRTSGRGTKPVTWQGKTRENVRGRPSARLNNVEVVAALQEENNSPLAEIVSHCHDALDDFRVP